MGPTARDLRRAHYTWDYPALCASCRMVAQAPPKSRLPFIDRVVADLGRDGSQVAATLVAEEPSHMSRQSDPPVIRVHRPEADVARWIVALALAGDSDEVAVCEIDPVDRGADGLDLPIDNELWESLASNLGYWWSVFALSEGPEQPCLRSEEIRCIVRHEHMPRVPGSTLGYADVGHAPAIYLGGEREVGWTDRATLPGRPRVGGVPEGIQYAGAAVPDGTPKARRRDPQQPSVVTPKAYSELVDRVRTAAQNGNGKRRTPDYPALVRRVCDLVQRSLPDDATVLVASKGDAALLDLERARACISRLAPAEPMLGTIRPTTSGRSTTSSPLAVAAPDFCCCPTRTAGGSTTTPASPSTFASATPRSARSLTPA